MSVYCGQMSLILLREVTSKIMLQISKSILSSPSTNNSKQNDVECQFSFSMEIDFLNRI